MAEATTDKRFQFWMPAELSKGDGEDAGYRIKGYASVEGLDHAEEEVLQEGLDFSYWQKEGFFKWGHESKDRPSQPSDFVGTGDVAEIRTLEDGTKATYVEGPLLKTAKAQQVAELSEALTATGRQLGLSVEGFIRERLTEDQRRIAEAVVIDVAIDPHPMHPDARMTVEGLARSLSAGHPAPASTPGTGAALMPQSIEGGTAEAEPKAGGDLLDLDRAALAAMKQHPELTYKQATDVVTAVTEFLKACAPKAPQKEGATP